MTKKLTKLDAIRGLSAVYVVLGHTFIDILKKEAPVFSYLLRFGQEAVILFFILSGFVIHYSFERAKDRSFKTFFLKRFLRIYIPLIIIFLTNYLLLSWYQGSWHVIDFYNLLGNLLMLQDAQNLKTNTICGTFLGNSPLWSLSYEWWFYMIYFVVRTRISKNSNLFIYSIGIIAAISYVIYPNFVNRLFIYLVIWWVGVEFATLHLKNESLTLKSLQKPLITLVVCVVILAANVPLNYIRITQELGVNGTIGESPWLELRHFGFALLAILTAIFWSKHKWALFDKTVGIFEPVAKISFALYISHWFLLSRATYLDFLDVPYTLSIIIYCVITILFSYSIEILIYPKLNKWIMAYFYKPNKKYHISNAHTHIRN